LWFQKPNERVYTFAAKVLTAFLVASDLILPQLQRLQEKLHRVLTVRVPKMRSTAPPGASDEQHLEGLRFCPAADIAEQGVLISEAAYIRQFHSSITAPKTLMEEVQSHERLPAYFGEGPPKYANVTSREAWVSVLFGGSNQDSTLFNVEVLRTLAYSVARSENPLARRAFVVFTVGHMSDTALKDLQSDGIMVRSMADEDVVDMWKTTFVRRPWFVSSWFTERGLSRTFAQLAAFSLEEYDRVVYIDMDMLLLKSSDELFELAELGFAATKETHRDQTDIQGTFNEFSAHRTYLYNTGLMAIKPDRRVLKLVKEYLERDDFRWAVERIGIGEPTIQDLMDIFWLFRSARLFSITAQTWPADRRSRLTKPRLVGTFPVQCS